MDIANAMQKYTKANTNSHVQSLSSHKIHILHVSDMFWLACGNSLVVNYDEVVHETMDGRFFTRSCLTN
jgi:hypothetical protein